METVMTTEAGRIVIIGGGHNGLVAAFYLAKAGFAPLVLEARDLVGGVAATEEIHPGFWCPAILHSIGPLLPQIAKDMQLPDAPMTDVCTLALHPGGRVLRFYRDPQRTAAELAAFSSRDASRYSEFCAAFSRLGAALRPMMSTTPPDIDNLKITDYLNLGRFGLTFRSLDRKDAYRLLRWTPMPVADLMAEWFETDLLRAVFAARGVFGSYAGPASAGTSVGLLMPAALGGDVVSFRGGVAGLSKSLAKAASAAGAQIRTNARVVRINVQHGRCRSVVLESGEEIIAGTVISNADPSQTFLKLVDAADLDPGFLMRVRSYRAMGTVAKVNLALSALPAFSGITNGASDLSGGIHIGPDTSYIERAFDAAKYGEFSEQPFMEISIPSVKDPSLAPQGSHVMSILVQYAPYRLKHGDWKSQRDQFAETVLNVLALYAPKIRDVIVHRQVITPLDMEQTYGLSGGHINHGEHALDQLFSFRPFLGWSQYRTPIQGLYLCGSGTHPGGGITGAPGANAGREINKDLKSRWTRESHAR
jgi:phytoene dehydrogenase-like protein